MALVEGIYQGRGIPAGTKKERVLQVHNALVERLLEKLNRRYLWLAACTVAVEAGYHGARRRIRQRQRLLAAVNECRRYLGEEPLTLPKGWEEANLYYGYSALHNFRQQTGLSLTEVVNLSFALSGKLTAAGAIQALTDNS